MSSVKLKMEIAKKAVNVQKRNDTIRDLKRSNNVELNALKNDFVEYYTIQKQNKSKEKAEILRDTIKHIKGKFELFNTSKNNSILWDLLEDITVYYENNLSLNINTLDYRILRRVINLFNISKDIELKKDLIITISKTQKIELKKGNINPFYNVVTKNGIKKNSNCIEFYIKEKGALMDAIKAEIIKAYFENNKKETSKKANNTILEGEIIEDTQFLIGA